MTANLHPAQPDAPLPPNEVAERHRRIAAFLERNGYRALVLARRDSFAWASGGGDSTVISTGDAGAGVLVFTRGRRWLVARSMDGQRIMDEELAGQGYELVERRWYEESPLEAAAALVAGSGGVAGGRAAGGGVAADVPYPGWELVDPAPLQFPLSPGELARLRWLGAASDELMAEVAAGCRPGMAERDIAARLAAAAAARQMAVGVLIVGADDRIARYRHPMPTARPVDRILLLHTAARRWGLHCNVSRMVCFGPAPAELRQRYAAALRVQAAALAGARPGRPYAGVLAAMQAEYAAAGYPDEWRGHFQGALSAYRLADPEIMTRPGEQVPPGAAHDWFITITGVKVEEVAIETPAGPEVVSVTGRWPTVRVAAGDAAFTLAGLWER